MTDVSSPTNAQEWAVYLNRKKLSSPFRVGEFVIKKLQRDPLSYAQLASIINKDPILAFEIITYVNKESEQHATNNSDGSKTLAHALSMMGIEGLKDAIERLPRKPISPKNITSFYYLRTLCTSLYAGYLARAISLKKKKGNPEDIYWSGLFIGAPIWHLWRFATPEMRLVRYAIRSNYKLPQVAETEVLGDTLQNITRALSKELALPKLAQECFILENQPSYKDWVKMAHCLDPSKRICQIDDVELKIKMQRPHFIVQLANLLAHYSSYCWYSRATLRAQRILAYYLGCTLEEAISFSHEIAAEMSQSHPLPGLMLPAAKLFIPPRKRTKAHTVKNIDAFQESTFDTTALPKEVVEIQKREDTIIKTLPDENERFTKADQQPKASTLEDTRSLPEKKSPPAKTDDDRITAPPASQLTDNKTKAEPVKPSAEPQETPPPVKNTALYDELIHLMHNRPEEFSDFHELMNSATQGIAYGIELKRAFVALVSKDCSRVKTYYNVGCSDYDGIKNFESKIIKDTIFGKLCERPASIWVKPSSERKIKDLIPMNFKSVVDNPEFFLMSVFVGKRPVAIFYADNLNGDTLNDRKYKQFKQLCGGVSAALQYQAKQSRQSSADNS